MTRTLAADLIAADVFMAAHTITDTRPALDGGPLDLGPEPVGGWPHLQVLAALRADLDLEDSVDLYGGAAPTIAATGQSALHLEYTPRLVTTAGVGGPATINVLQAVHGTDRFGYVDVPWEFTTATEAHARITRWLRDEAQRAAASTPAAQLRMAWRDWTRTTSLPRPRREVLDDVRRLIRHAITGR